jgi:hypothetical protein
LNFAIMSTNSFGYRQLGTWPEIWLALLVASIAVFAANYFASTYYSGQENQARAGQTAGPVPEACQVFERIASGNAVPSPFRATGTYR